MLRARRCVELGRQPMPLLIVDEREACRATSGGDSASNERTGSV